MDINCVLALPPEGREATDALFVDTFWKKYQRVYFPTRVKLSTMKIMKMPKKE